MSLRQLFLLLALVGSAGSLRCHVNQAGNTVVRDDTTVECKPIARFCYKYIETTTDADGNKYSSVYKGCAGDPDYTVPGICRVGAECEENGRAAWSSSLSYGATFDEAFYCCDKDLCNAAGRSIAGVGLGLLAAVVVTYLKHC